jgi:hypothetical protein
MAIYLNGSTDYYYTDATDGDFEYTGDFTINIWFNPVNFVGTPYIRDCHGGSNSHVMYLTTGGALGAYSGSGLAISGGTITPGTWNMGTMTRIGTTVALYLNSVSVGSQTFATTLGNAAQGSHIGSIGGAGTNKFNGTIGIHQEYKGYGLTQADIDSKYNSLGVDNITTGLIFDARLNENPSGSNPTANELLDITGRHTQTVITTAVYKEAPFRITK